MLLGFCAHACPGKSLRELLPELAAWGYQAVELSAWPQHPCHPTKLRKALRGWLCDSLEEHGLVLSAVAAHTQWVGAESFVTQRALEYTVRCIDLAVELGAPTVITNSGPYPLEGNRHDHWDWLVEGLRGAACYAAEQDVVLALEPHVNHIIFTWESARNVIHQVDSPYLQINFDASHWYISGADHAVALERLSPYVVHVHLQDHLLSKSALPDASSVPCALGEGTYGLEEHLVQLSRLGYEGVLSVELCAPNLDRAAAKSAEMVLRLLDNL